VNRKKQGKYPSLATKKKATDERDSIQVLTDLEQIRVLADPLRIRILELLCDEELTTKQVARKLDEKATRLYHHVEALERVGLIRLTRTRQNRGTIEKYFIGVAKAFRADPQTFMGKPRSETGEALGAMIDTITDTVANELRQLVMIPGGAESLEADGLLSFFEIHTGQDEIDKLQEKLNDTVMKLADDCVEEPAEGDRRYRLLVAFYPLDKDTRKAD
jgi:DNA-binding transcriptional ArsR family regulator